MKALDLSDSPTGAGALCLIGRVLLGTPFLVSCIETLMTPADSISYIASAGVPLPQLGFALQLLIEGPGAVAMIAGFHVRAIAGALAVFCVVTAMLFHLDFSAGDQQWQFLKNLAMAGGLLQIVAFGPGRFSFDQSRANR